MLKAVSLVANSSTSLAVVVENVSSAGLQPVSVIGAPAIDALRALGRPNQTSSERLKDPPPNSMPLPIKAGTNPGAWIKRLAR